MAIDALGTAIAATGGTSGKAAGAAAKLADTYDSFLKLLTTQLRHQDPLAPMDSNEFVSQLVDFAGVEQQIASNTNLEKLIALQSGGMANGALGYIGKTIEADGDTNALIDGKAEFAYTLPKNSAATQVAILDALGRQVNAYAGQTSAGRHGFTWNGEDAAGNDVPEGEYRIRVTAMDSTGATITSATSIIGRVTGIESGPSGILLGLGSTKVPLLNVLSVSETAG